MKSKLQYQKTNIRMYVQPYLTSHTWTFVHTVKREHDIYKLKIEENNTKIIENMKPM